jgi:beta-lactamase class A
MPANDEKPVAYRDFVLDYSTPVTPEFQKKFETADQKARAKWIIEPSQTAAGLLDLKRLRLALVRPDWMTYGASVPKIGILLAYFQLRPEAVVGLDPQRRHELGLMIKPSSNEMAAKYSQELGLRPIQDVLCSMGFYDAKHGGGIWVGKHYGITGERIGDPLGDFSHAVTVRQVMRYYLALEQKTLISESASTTMREIFESPDIPHERNKFLAGLKGREVQVIRKSGSWEHWLHDSAVVTGPGRHYILVGLTEHPKGDDYLCDLAQAADDLILAEGRP